MIEDLKRIIKKGKNDTIVNLKIKEFHKLEFDQRNKKTIEEYQRLSHLLLDNKDQRKRIADEFSNEGKAVQNEIDNLSAKIESLEENNSWLLELNEDDSINTPEFSMSDEQIETFRNLHWNKFRQADYESKNQFELIADGLFDQHQINVKNRWPKPPID